MMVERGDSDGEGLGLGFVAVILGRDGVGVGFEGVKVLGKGYYWGGFGIVGEA